MDLFKRWIYEKNYSLEDLSNEFNIDKNDLKSIINKEKELDINLAVRISLFSGISLNDLLR